ncbi:MAG: DUF2934 domain-containing protein [Methylovulum sp.]|jgi:hypothetical protein
MTTKRANKLPPQQQWIAVAAYYKALSRGFTPHNAQQDWLEAEQELSHYSQLAPKKIGLITLRRA